MAVLRYLRGKELKRGYVSEITGFPYATLSKWNQDYDDNYRKVAREDHRGIHNLVSQGYIEFIVKSTREYMERQKGAGRIKHLKAYLRWLWKSKKEELKHYPFGKSRRVITEILVAHDLYKPKANKRKYPGYKPRIQRYYPGAQIVMDGKEIKIIFNEKTYGFNLEMSKDMKSDAITSHRISDEETAETVVSVLEDHIQKHGSPLSVLLDNSSANLSEEVEKLLQQRDLIKIKTFPGHAQTKGDIEGEYSKIQEKVGTIKIHGKTEKQIAMSIVETIINLYVQMRNQTPRCSVCKQLPLDLINYKPTEQQRHSARCSLKKQQKQSESLRNKSRGPISEEKEWFICSVIQRNRLEVSDLQRFQKVLNRYDMKAIHQAEEDFYAYSQRQSFEETKRTGQYFVGIVRNKQIEIDHEKKKELLKKRYLIHEKWKKNRQELQRIQQEKEAEKNRKKYPEKVVVQGLVEGKKIVQIIGKVPGFLLKEIRKSLEIILSKQNWKMYLERLKKEIMSLTEYTPGQRLEMVQLANQWVEDSKKWGVKSVTLF